MNGTATFTAARKRKSPSRRVNARISPAPYTGPASKIATIKDDPHTLKRRASFVRSNTALRRARSSASRMRKRLSDIEMEVGTQLLKLSAIESEHEGSLTYEEFRTVLQNNCTTHVTDEEARQLMIKYDTNKNGTIEMEEFIADHNVPTISFHEFLDRKEAQREACHAFPFTVMLCGMFLFVLFFQAKTSEAYRVKAVVTDTLIFGRAPVPGNTILTVSDLWTWAKTSLVGAMSLQTPMCGESTGRTCIGRDNFVLSNQIMLQQERDETSDMLICDKGNDLANIYAPDGCDHSKLGLPICSDEAGNVTCVPKPEWDVSQRWPKDALNSSSEGFEYRNMPDFDCFGGFYCSGGLEGYMYKLDTGSPQELLKQLTYLEDRRWLDNRTTYMRVLFVIYTPKVGLLSKVMMEFAFNHGGHIDVDLLVESILEPVAYQSMDIMNSILWGVLIVAMPIYEINAQRKQLLAHCKSFWTNQWRILMFFQLTFLISMFVIWRKLTAMALEFVQESVKGKGEISQLHQAVDHFFLYRSIAVVVDLIFLLQFLRSFLAIDQLAIIFLTLKRSIYELMHFLIILFMLMMVTISSSMFIFGNQVKGFSHVMGALAQNFDGIVGGLKIHSVLTVGHIKYIALAWWVLYIFFIVIVVFNMMLAIVLRSYEQVYQQHANARSVYDQVSHEFILARAKIKGWLTLSPIVDIFETSEEIAMCPVVSAGILYRCLEEAGCPGVLCNKIYARGYLLALVKEYVEAQDTESKGHDMQAYKRIDELDRDFEHLHTRMDDISVGVATVVDCFDKD